MSNESMLSRHFESASIEERLRLERTNDNVRTVADATTPHFVELTSGIDNTSDNERSVRAAARGVTVRLLTSLIESGELRRDFDADAVVTELNVIGRNGQSDA